MKKIEADSLKGILVHSGIVLALILFFILIFFFEVLPFATNKNEIVTVPELRGMTLSESSERLTKSDLGYQILDSTFDASLEPFTVVEQFPRRLEKVKINRKIGLRLNAKIPPAVSYPELEGSSLLFAFDQLKSAGLKVGIIQYRPDIAYNSVLESQHDGLIVFSGQRLPMGSVVDLIVGVNDDQFPLPDFSGKSFDEIETVLLGMNLKIGEVHEVEATTEQPDTIQKQSPEAGDTVKQGDAIELWIYKQKHN